MLHFVCELVGDDEIASKFLVEVLELLAARCEHYLLLTPFKSSPTSVVPLLPGPNVMLEILCRSLMRA